MKPWLESRAETEPAHPPRPPFVLGIGVTGHRAEALNESAPGALAARVRSALELIRDCALATHAREPQHFSADPPRLQFVSPLAAGADQIAAEVAASLQIPIQAVLPFDRDEYRTDLAGAERDRFEALLAAAECVLELPGRRDREAEAYMMAGRATVAHCDVLIAVWDGRPPRGRGGTADVVQLALARGTPIVHLHIDESIPPSLIWSAFDPNVLTDAPGEAAERPFDAEHLAQMFDATLLPPDDPQERRFLAQFANERGRRYRARIEYQLLLAAAGVAPLRLANLRESRAADSIREEWSGFREACIAPHRLDPRLALTEEAYSWSDRLATRFAQTYRSGHVFNFVLGGIAVCMGLSTFMVPHLYLEMAVAEFIITLGIILNTKIGVKNEWHRRWLDYRQLAERLRPMRSLKLLGLAAPDPPGTIVNPVPRRWIEWYAAAIWRGIGCPAGEIDAPCADAIAQAVATHEIAPQVAYHEKSARQIDLLDERLEKIATSIFYATLFVCVAVAAGQIWAPTWVEQLNDWFTLVSAGFPALGTAVFGIRFQGDFGGSAVRSQGTADQLRRIHDELGKDVTLGRAADLTEQAARTMLADLDEWRLVNQQQELGMA